MNHIFIIIFVTLGIGIPIMYTVTTSNPKSILNKIIKELKDNPRDLWYQYFTLKGLENWNESGFNLDEFEDFQILEYKYKDYIWNYKIKINYLDREEYYIIKLVKFPDIRAKSRWIINSIIKVS